MWGRRPGHSAPPFYHRLRCEAILALGLVHRPHHVDVLRLGAGQVKELALVRPLFGDGPKRKALEVGRALAQLHVRPLNHRVADEVVERLTYSNGDTGWCSASRYDRFMSLKQRTCPSLTLRSIVCYTLSSCGDSILSQIARRVLKCL